MSKYNNKSSTYFNSIHKIIIMEIIIFECIAISFLPTCSAIHTIPYMLATWVFSAFWMKIFLFLSMLGLSYHWISSINQSGCFVKATVVLSSTKQLTHVCMISHYLGWLVGVLETSLYTLHAVARSSINKRFRDVEAIQAANLKVKPCTQLPEKYANLVSVSNTKTPKFC